MKYVVTYCAFDREAGANPLWHSCILLSKMDETTKQLEVVDNWGFYGVPTTQRENTWTNFLKRKMGLDIDLAGNHGMLRHEEIRFLDLGRGLHGVTFELTEAQFNYLQGKCLEMRLQQDEAIKEIVEPLMLKKKSPELVKIYPYEHRSRQIYELEKVRAEENNRPPRLQPFEFRLTWGLTGPSMATSSTCKSQSIAMLRHVLSDEQIARLTENNTHPTVPKHSGRLETIYLHSTGPLRQHRKSSGDVVYYRDAEKDPEVKLYWTVPPQELEALSEDTIKLFEIDDEYCHTVKTVAGRLQRLEWLLRNAAVPECYKDYQEQLVLRIVDHYKAFSIIEPKKDAPELSGLQSFACRLFSLPRSREEQMLQKKINNAKMLFNSLYLTIVDGIKIDDRFPMERTSEQVADSSSEQVPAENPLESLAYHLSVNDKKALCTIIGRNYIGEETLTDQFAEEEDSAFHAGASSSFASAH